MKKGFTLAEGATHVAQFPKPSCAAFTLAEVLITLGIIGVVAAMTLPTLIQNYRKHEVETKLAKFYSVMNQAIKLSEVENGEMSAWGDIQSGFEKDANNNDDYSKPKDEAWLNKYIFPYLSAAEIEKMPGSNLFAVHFKDGTLALFGAESVSYYVDKKAYKSVENSHGFSANIYDKTQTGRKVFTFLFRPAKMCEYSTIPTPYKYICDGAGLEAYKFDWDGTEEHLRNRTDISCNANATNEAAYCTALIQLYGWKIPKDYPFKF